MLARNYFLDGTVMSPTTAAKRENILSLEGVIQPRIKLGVRLASFYEPDPPRARRALQAAAAAGAAYAITGGMFSLLYIYIAIAIVIAITIKNDVVWTSAVTI